MEQPRSHGLLNEVVSFPLAHVLPAEPRAPGFPRLIGTGDSGNNNGGGPASRTCSVNGVGWRSPR